MHQGPDTAPPVQAVPRLTWLILLAGMMVAGVACRVGLSKMTDVWVGSEEYSHALLVPFIVAFLIWQRRGRIARTGCTGSWAGFGLVAAGCLVMALGRLSALLVAEQYALLVVAWGLVLALAGPRVLRLLAAPMLLLVFLVPLPQFLLQGLSAELQLISSKLGVLFLRLLGVTVLQQGNVIDLGSMRLEVAQACSGLRYLFPLMALALIVSYIYRAPWWKRMLVFASSFPVTILMNSLRLALIGVLVEGFGPSMAGGFLHDFEGWVVFMLSVGVLLAEVRLLGGHGGRHSLRELLMLPADQQPVATARSIVLPLSRPLVASTALLAAVALALSLAPGRVRQPPARASFATFPDRVGPWQGQLQVMPADFLRTLDLDDYYLATFSRDGYAPVNFYVAWYDSQAAGESVHSPRSCLPGGGWHIDDFEQRALADVAVKGRPLRVNRVLISDSAQRQLVYYYFQQRGRVLTNEYLVKWDLVVDALTRHRSDGALVRFVVPLRPGQSADAADAELAGFVREVAPRLAPYIPD